MEPPAALARRDGDNWDIWAPVQSPGGTREDVAKALGVADGQVTLHTTLLGGGFGRKSKCDLRDRGGAAVQGARWRAGQGVWTREDDIRHGFYHTVTADRFEAGSTPPTRWWRGVIVARRRASWPTSCPIRTSKRDRARHGMGRCAFNVPNMRMESGEAAAQVRIGWFRSVTT